MEKTSSSSVKSGGRSGIPSGRVLTVTLVTVVLTLCMCVCVCVCVCVLGHCTYNMYMHACMYTCAYARVNYLGLTGVVLGPALFPASTREEITAKVWLLS